MSKYMIIYHAPAGAWDATSSTQEEREESMKAWMKWAADCGDNLLDLGAPLMNGIKLNSDGTKNDSNSNVMGYSILQADDMENAQSFLVDHPHLLWDSTCTIELHEIMPVPGM